MKQVRLLPIVVAAGAALLVFKTIGVVTGSGYILDGPGTGVAQETAQVAEGREAESFAEQMTASPGEAAASMLEGENGATASGDVDAMVSELLAEAGIEDPEEMAGDAPEGEAVADGQTAEMTADAAPTTVNPEGETVPLAGGDMVSDTERQILTRLAERRGELDQYAADLDLRAAVVEAAELRLQERIAELTALQDEINALLAEKQSADDAQFTALVSMYEAMKPKDAAAIFNRLSVAILTRVARAMNPRRMSPILAEMDPEKAEVLTIQLASIDPEPMRDPSATDLDSLPQIVGQ